MQKLAIVGSQKDTRENAPFDDPSFDIWVFNEAPQAAWCKRWTACFQMHREQNYTSRNNWINKGHWDWLQQGHGLNKIIWMQRFDERVPNCHVYPLEEIFQSVPGADLKWIESTPAYALALAIHLGYEEIEIYGCEMASGTEYAYQLNNFQYWIGIAKGMGLKLTLKSGEWQFHARLYAYEGETQIERIWFAERARSFDAQWQLEDHKLKRVKVNLDAALLDRKYQEVAKLIVDFREQGILVGQLSGRMKEAENYAGRDDPITRQEYERRAAQSQMDGEGHRAMMYHAGGKIEYVYNLWSQSGNFQALQQLRAFIQEQAKAAYDLGAHLGINRENLEYIHQYDERLTAAGGQRAIEALMPVLTTGVTIG